MKKLGIIGGTGLSTLDGLEIIKRVVVHTPYGEPSAPLTLGVLHDNEVVFLPRHGAAHTIPPHKINYCANIHALKEAGVTDIVAVAAVGGIGERVGPGVLAIPNQIIDYTWGRKSTFFEDGLKSVVHIDFTEPYHAPLRQQLLGCAKELEIDILDGGVYGATQGPRLESSAEIQRMERDGCTLVGMTGMPEAALAREAEMNYACCAISANWAAGKSDEEITMEKIEVALSSGMAEVKRLLVQLILRF